MGMILAYNLNCCGKLKADTPLKKEKTLQMTGI
jgi:hypothetical protein